VKPTYTFHVVSFDKGNRVRNIEAAADSDMRINGGFFVLRSEIFNYLEPGDELVEQPFHRLIQADRLLGYRYDGFWAPMDTMKDRQNLNMLFESGERPWAIWEKQPSLVTPTVVLEV
jgi:glucose-1-phosphate cytidylyltransferase